MIKTYNDLINVLSKYKKTEADLLSDLKFDKEVLRKWQMGIPPTEQELWAITNQINLYGGINSNRSYRHETYKPLKDLTKSKDLFVPHEYEDILIAYSEGMDSLTQNEIDEIIEFYKSSRDRKK